MPDLSPAIVVLNAAGMGVAKQIKAALPGAEIWGQASRGLTASSDRAFQDALITIKLLFEAGRPVIGVCASGILIRAVAGSLANKDQEPPVLAVSNDGASVVPLLGGHKGANIMALDLAKALEGKAAVTTAGDVSLGLALDEPPECWWLANKQDYKAFTAQLLSGASVNLSLQGPSAGADWLGQSELPLAANAGLKIRETIYADDQAGEGELLYVARKVCIGVGCERDLAPSKLQALASQVLADNNIDIRAVAGVYSIDLKADEPAVHALAKTYGVQARFLTPDQLNEKREYLAHPSEVVFGETGSYGVCEGAALVAAQSNSLAVAKVKGEGCTIALSIADDARVPHQDSVGVPQGRLTLIGLGPGDRHWRSVAAQKALDEASDWVGFKLYLDIACAEGMPDAKLHSFPIGEEEDRCRYALELAATGRDVALVCSGDPGIYAMSALVLQLLDESDRKDWRRVKLAFEPGITAMQGAVAKSGAMMGHDFCAISLSDLMTPWDAIERRIAAASVSDMVVAFYNPVSMRRRTQLKRAQTLLLQNRPADTPVVLGRNVGRPTEIIEHTTLRALDPETVDMLTVVVVGASQSKRIDMPSGDIWAYTPRGYEPKMEEIALPNRDEATDGVKVQH